MSDLELTYQRRLKKMTDEADKTNKYYLSAIKKLKEDHKQLFASKQALMLRLKAINTGLEFERKRRIKKAIYDNESDRYKKDTATLNSIKKLTKIGSNTNLKIEDFDFGNKFSANNIQIIKGVTYAKKGITSFWQSIVISKEEMNSLLRSFYLVNPISISFMMSKQVCITFSHRNLIHLTQQKYSCN